MVKEHGFVVSTSCGAFFLNQFKTKNTKALNAFNFMRNDCYYNTECDHCGHQEVDKFGYNDEYYRVKVIPAQHCSKCGKDSQGNTIEQKQQKEEK